MILILNKNADEHTANTLKKRLERMGLGVALQQDEQGFRLAVSSGLDHRTQIESFRHLPYVEDIKPLEEDFALASRSLRPKPSVIDLKGHTIGGGTLTLMAGPCSIESEEQMMQTASAVAAAGAQILRGGAFKPRTSPYSFQGLGEEGLKLMSAAAQANNMLCVSEIIDVSDIDLMGQYVDILQIGARNMQNFVLLQAVGRSGKPVLLKRGMSATYRDLLFAAEYILNEGNQNVMLCERGIRTFETYTRNTLDIAAVPVLKELSHLPVIIDPSHGTGIRSMVPPLARAAVAAGADGIIVEVHIRPDEAVSDSKQTLSTETFAEMAESLRRIKQVI